MSIFQSPARRRKAAEENTRQREKEQRQRVEREEWKRIATKVRDFASRRFLRGQGIEIGGLNCPLPLFEGAVAKYVDRLPTEELRKAYPAVDDQQQVEVDIVDNGETLQTIADATVDFVIANHMLEHTRNPIATVENFLRVVKPGGIVFMAIPDKRFTFDKDRDITPFAHIREDYRNGPEWSDRGHYEEWARKVRKFSTEDEVEKFITDGLAGHGNIHYHVWTHTEIVEMFILMRGELRFLLELEASIQNGHEVVVVLRKTSD